MKTGCALPADINLFVRSGDMSEFDTQFLKAIEELKAQIDNDIQIDHKIGADPYCNVARLKVCETIEKIYLRLSETIGEQYV